MARSLTAPFALLGAAGGWLTAEVLGLGRSTSELSLPDDLIRVLLVLVTPRSGREVRATWGLRAVVAGARWRRWRRRSRW